MAKAAHHDRLIAKLAELDAQVEQFDQCLLDPEVQTDHRKVTLISVKRAALLPLVEKFRAWRRLSSEADELTEVIAEQADADLVELARTELPGLRRDAATLLDEVQRELVTADDRAVASIIVEVRAGVGGDEAALWAGDLQSMYRRYAGRRRWTVEDLAVSPGEQGGFKAVFLRITGGAVWANLGYEGGTHQVKRVPATETQGRIHTSTATVAVLPEPEDIEIDLDPNDVKEMITTAQGPGGQNVNKVATAVHLIHEPSGVEVRMQDTKSQARNREKAWRLLKARLYERQKSDAQRERSEARSIMIGTGRRAEKIRTYRYKENIVTDRRVSGSFNLGDLMSGDLQKLIDALIEHDTAQRLASL